MISISADPMFLKMLDLHLQNIGSTEISIFTKNMSNF